MQYNFCCSSTSNNHAILYANSTVHSTTAAWRQHTTLCHSWLNYANAVLFVSQQPVISINCSLHWTQLLARPPSYASATELHRQLCSLPIHVTDVQAGSRHILNVIHRHPTYPAFTFHSWLPTAMHSVIAWQITTRYTADNASVVGESLQC